MYCRAEEFRSVTFFVSTEGKQTGQEEETGYREARLTGWKAASSQTHGNIAAQPESCPAEHTLSG